MQNETEFDPRQALGQNGLFATRWPPLNTARRSKDVRLSLVHLQQGGYLWWPELVPVSLAYLYPVYLAFQENNINGPVIISTYTINLQQQLIEKEIPFLNKTLENRYKPPSSSAAAITYVGVNYSTINKSPTCFRRNYGAGWKGSTVLPRTGSAVLNSLVIL